MNEIRTPGPAVLVGIDGSRSAVRAALWAVDEALHRRLPLRLVHVTPQTEFPSSATNAVLLGLRCDMRSVRSAPPTNP